MTLVQNDRLAVVKIGLVNIIPQAIRYQADLRLKANELVVLLNILLGYEGGDGSVLIEKDTIAARVGKDVRTVQRVVKTLEQKSLVVRHPHYADNGQQVGNEYDVRPLARLIQSFNSNEI